MWVGGGFPTIDPTQIDGDDALEVKHTLQHVTDLMLDTRITLYAVDPGSTAAGVTEITNPDQAAFVMAAGDALSGNADPFGANEDFDRLGPVTGGVLVRGRNDVSQLIAASVDLGANYYTISYSPANLNEESAQYRKIQVLCLKPGLKATTRTGYYAGAINTRDARADAIYDLTTAAEGELPLRGLDVTAKPESVAGTYDVRVGAARLAWKPAEDGSSSASVYILAVLLDEKGHMLAHTLHGMTAHARAGAALNDPAKMADFAFAVQPAAKAVTLRFIVRDNGNGRMGSFDMPFKGK